MKKICLFLILILLSFSLYGRSIIEKEDDGVITELDVIETFVQELNKPRYAYCLYDYEVYKSKSKQNHSWEVCVEDCSYSDNRRNVSGEEVILYVPNGYFTVKTFGGETQLSTFCDGVKDAYLMNDEKERKSFFDDFIQALHFFVSDCYNWGSRYKLSSDAMKNIAELSFIVYDDFIFSTELILHSIIFDYYDGYYNKTNPDIYVSDNDYEGSAIYDDYINMLFEMSNYEYSLQNLTSITTFDENIPKGVKKYLSCINCNKTYRASDQREYIILEFTVEDQEDENYYHNFDIEIENPIFSDEKLTEEEIDLIRASVGEDVYIQGIIDKHNTKAENYNK